MTDFLARALEARPDALALADGHRRWSFRELARDADELARRLGSSAGPGSVVVLVLPASAASVVAIHGVARAGGVVAPLNPRLTAHEMDAVLRIVRPAAVVTTAGDAGRVRAAAGAAGIHLDADPEPLPGPAMGLRAPGRGALSLKGAGAAALLWTSGTAGPSRGILLAGSALAHVAAASRERLDLSPADRWYASLSPAHMGGLALVTRAALVRSAVVTREALDLAELWELMESGAVSHASLVPVLLRRLLEVGGDRPAPPGLRGLLVGGAPATRPLVERALELGYPVALTYGLTEATSQVTTAAPDLVRRKPWTVGSPLPGVEVRLDDDGEIFVRGPTLSLGTVGPEGLALRDEGGWLRTGDLGEWDEEGDLRITGRRSDRIVTGGITVDPGEVEAVVLAHPAVREAAVVGIPDAEWGERVAAALVMVPGAPSQLDDVEVLCRERLTPAKVPRHLRAVDRLPRNANGKVDRSAVRALLQ